jgi:hypothetical protein
MKLKAAHWCSRRRKFCELKWLILMHKYYATVMPRASGLTCAFLLLCAGGFSKISAARSEPKTIRKSKPIAIVAPKKLLFLPFYNEAANKNFAWLETTIGHSLHESAKQKYNYEKVDDNDFSVYFINKGYAASDLYNFEKIAKIAHDLGVDGVIYGTFKPDASKANVVVTGKILSVIDREIIAEKTITMPVSAEMFESVEEVSQALGENIKNLFYPSDKGALTRAAVLPGWGHTYKQRKTWGYVWGGLFWTAASFTALSTVQYVRYTILYKNYEPEHFRSASGGVGFQDQTAAQAQFDSYGSSIKTWGLMTVIGLASVTAIYLGNLLHAYFINPDVVANSGLSATNSGAQLRIQMIPEADLNRVATGLNAPLRGEVSLVWRF